MNVQAITDIAIRGSPGRAQPAAPQPPRPANQSPAPEQASMARGSEPSPEEVAKALEGLNAFLASGNKHIQFAMHEATNRVIVEVIDNETQEVVKTIPSRELLDLAARIGEMVGTLLDRKG